MARWYRPSKNKGMCDACSSGMPRIIRNAKRLHPLYAIWPDGIAIPCNDAFGKLVPAVRPRKKARRRADNGK